MAWEGSLDFSGLADRLIKKMRQIWKEIGIKAELISSIELEISDKFLAVAEEMVEIVVEKTVEK